MGTLISHTMATFSAAKTTQLTQFTKAAGQFKNKTVAKASVSNTIEAKGKTCKVAINGFGRIGRNFLRCWHGRGKDTLLEVVAINDSGGVKQASHLVKYDFVLGTFEADVKIVDDTHMSIDGKSIQIVSSRDPLQLPWKALGVDIVIEGTGVFIDTPGASKHLTAGAKKVVITAPAKGDDIPTYVLGVNADQYKNTDKIVVQTSKKVTADEVNAAFREEAAGKLKGILAVADEPLVSCDFKCSDVSTSIDAALTMVMGDDMSKVVAWYDNEWGYSQRVVDLAELCAANWE